MATSLTSTGVTFPDATTQTTAATSAGGTLEAVASGALSTGDMVVVNTDGTVSVVEAVPGSAGATVTAAAVNASYMSAVFDSSSNKVVVFYVNNANGYGYGVVGTVSGTTISYGSPTAFDTGGVAWISAAFDTTNNKIVVGFRSGTWSNGIGAVVGTVSGTSISFGTPQNISYDTATYISTVYNPNAGKVVISWRNVGGSNYGTSIVGAVSGTSINFGSTYIFNSATTSYVTQVYDAASQNIVIAYRDDGNVFYGTAIVGAVSGTSITFGSEVVFNSGSTNYISMAYDSVNSKVVVVYRQGSSTPYYGYASVGTVSGTSISFGSPGTFQSGEANWTASTYDSTSQKVIIFYEDASGTLYGKTVEGTVSGTSISFNTPVVSTSSAPTYSYAAYDSNAGKSVIFYRSSVTNYNESFVYTATGSTLTSENFVGVSDGNYSDTDTATVLIAGSVSDSQTGLTAGQTYYVQKDGTLSTTPGSPSVSAGTAISSTKLIVQG